MAALILNLNACGLNIMAITHHGTPRHSGLVMAGGAASMLNVIGNNVEVTEALVEAAESKLGKSLERYEPLLTSATIHMKVEPRGGGLHDEKHKGLEAHVAELTAVCKDKHTIKLEAECPDMYASLDELSDKFSRSMRKYKERKMDKGRGEGHAEAAAILADAALGVDEEEQDVPAM